ncbi:MAG TPA: winged helix-turn-helix transcriptional regulator [Pseudonocardiaceae bacterium]
MLTQQLRELEAAGIVARTVHDKVALNVSYAVVPAERCRLEPLIQALCDWGMSWAQNTSATFDALEERSAVK